MRPSIALTGAAALLGAVAWSGAASAQDVGVGIYIAPTYDYPPAYTREYPYEPRVYGYTRRYDDDGVVVTYRHRRGGCGTYRYWDGTQCVDARYRNDEWYWR